MTNPKSQIPNPKSLRPPQFGLRTLLLAVAACAVLASLYQWMSPMALAAVVLLVLAIIAHVAGNAIGTRLREIGSDRPFDDDASGRLRAKPKAEDFAPATRLGQRHGLGWPLLLATAIGTISGAVGGGVWTILASRGPVGPLNIAVGVVAFAVLGGIAAFAAYGFVQVGLTAVRQALAESKR